MRSFTRVLSVILLVAWMGFIFYLSSQPAETSSQVSGGVIEVIAESFYPDFENLSEPEKAEIVASFQFVARKSAHVGGFAVLGFLSFLTFVTYTRIKLFWRLALATSVSLLFAASDEFHQRFVPGRSCELRDFLLDSAGVVGAILLCLAFVEIIAPLRRKVAFKQRAKQSFSYFEPLDIEALNADINMNRFEVETEQPFNFEIPQVVTEQEVLEEPEEVDTEEVESEEIESEEVATEEIETEEIETEEVEVVDSYQTESEEQIVEEKAQINLSCEMEYAASVIGEAVIEVTKVCNKITAKGGENTKELVNLALGRNEVLKSEILQILSMETSFEQKQNLIQSEKTKTYDYFNSILAQMC